jgi:transposase
MERELWAELSAAISVVDAPFFDNPDYVYSTASIIRVYLWAVLHDRPTSWATAARNWDRATRPPQLPNQSTLSRRLRCRESQDFLHALQEKLRHLPQAGRCFKRLDGKPLSVAPHSTDRQAGWGRGAGQKAKGYKLHALWAGQAMPEAFRVASLQASEQEMARRMLRDLEGGGYVVADKNYDTNSLFDQAAAADHQLLCPRRYGPDKGLGHHRHSPCRLRCKDLLEGPTSRLTGWGPALLKQRRQIERDFGNLASFGGGLYTLPPWVRGHRRVHQYVWAKLLINAARIRCLARKSRSVA